jgi:hypothetical protein
MRINTAAHELLEKLQLLDALFAAHLALLANEADKGRADPTYAERFATCRDLLAFRVSELRAAQEARAIVEARYLDGRGALFPAVLAAWDEQVRSTQLIAEMAVRLAELDGVPPAVPTDTEALSRRTTELVADLVEPAKAEALEKLGEGGRALSVATGWLRTKLAPTAVAEGESVAEKEL